MKIKIDHTDQDPSASTRSFEQPKPGVYPAVLDDATVRTTGSGSQTEPRDIEVVVKITGDDYSGVRLWDYVSFSEAAQWKMDQLLLAAGVLSNKKRAKEFKTEKELERALKGTPVMIRVRGDSYEGEYRARVAQYLPGDEPDEEVETEDLPPAETDEDEADEQVEEYTYEDIAGMKIVELRSLADDLEIDHAGVKKADLRDAILEEMGFDEEEAPF